MLTAQTSGLGTEASVTKIGDQVIIDAGAGDDKIGITQDAAGNMTVEVNGKTQTFAGKDKDNLVIRDGDGNDTITVGKDVTVRLTLEGGKDDDEIEVDENSVTGQTIDGGDGNDRFKGGKGDDTIKGGKGNDTIEAGAGDDTVDGGEGRDYINGSKGKDKLSGGADNDVIYGGDDDDAIDGGDGDDYLEGSKGNDTITGGKGKDILSGGIGDDTLKGGDGDDVLYAGQGKDKLFGEKGSNKIFAQKGDTIEKNAKGIRNTVVTIELKGNPGGTNVVIDSGATDEFKERVEADLEMLRSSARGRKMLTALENSKQTIRITKTTDGNSEEVDGGGSNSYYDPVTKKKGTQQNSVINYNQSYLELDDAPPVVALFHEMAHAYDNTHGTLRDNVYDGKDKTDKQDPNQYDVANYERVAVGLPIDDDGKAKMPERLDPVHPADLTENALRDEMKIRRRNHYRI